MRSKYFRFATWEAGPPRTRSVDWIVQFFSESVHFQKKNVINYVHFRKNTKSTSYMGVSENSVPLHPMVLLIIIPFLNGYFIGGIPHFQTYPYVLFYSVMLTLPVPFQALFPGMSTKKVPAPSPEIRPKGRIQVHYMGRSTYVYYILYIYIYMWYIILYI